MNASFRISLLYLLLIIPQHGNSPLPVMESWLQKDQDDGFVQRDMTSSLTGGDESFGSAHQTYQNSLIRKKKADNSANALPGAGYRKFAGKFDQSQGYEQSNVFFNGPYMSKDYDSPVVDVERDDAVFEGFDSDPALSANKYHSRMSNLGNMNEENLNPRLMNNYKEDKNMGFFGNRMNSFREDGLNSLNDDLGRSAKWSLCKRLKQRYAPNPLMTFSPTMEGRNFNFGENNPVPSSYLAVDNERRNRAIRNQEYMEPGRPEGKNPQIFSESEYYDLEESPMTGEDDMNVEEEEYNQMPNGHSYMHKREERDHQQPYNQKMGAAQVVIDALTSRDATKSFADAPSSSGAVQASLTQVRMPKARDLNSVPESKLMWKLNSDLQSRALSDVVRDSQRALQEVQLFQQKLYKSPEGSENDGLKRESRNQPQPLKSEKKNIEFDEKRLKREDEDEQKNMKTGTDEGGGGEYEDEEGKGHKDEEEYYEDADLSDEESGNEVRTTDRLNQKYVKREAIADSSVKNSKEEQNDNPQDYELNLENAPVENAEKSRKSSYREGEKTKKNSARKGVKIWDQWGKWSPCSVTCGVGRSTRWRHCIGGGCAQGEKEAQIKRCTNPACR